MLELFLPQFILFLLLISSLAFKYQLNTLAVLIPTFCHHHDDKIVRINHLLHDPQITRSTTMANEYLVPYYLTLLLA